MMTRMEVTVLGGGLAGCEAAWQAARLNAAVRLVEMRPGRETGAHRGGDLAELVCSNSLGSSLPDRAGGLLQQEARGMGSLLLACAADCALPAGGALAVDRERFARLVTERIERHPRICVERREAVAIPESPAVLATGPLTSPDLADALEGLAGRDQLFFYDAMAPILREESIDRSVVFRASRYERGAREDGDYLNCPFSEEAFDRFLEALLSAERAPLKNFEQEIEKGVKAGRGPYFEGCLPVEVLAARGRRALAFGPLRPIGLRDPRTGRRPFAVAQLRQDNAAGSLYSLVGFQTNLTRPAQERVFRLIPGLEAAAFVRHGQMHRNTFLCAPHLLAPSLAWRERAGLFAAGQLAGVEGYVGAIATGLVAGVNAARFAQGLPPRVLPPATMTGALCHYLAGADPDTFQPMKANFGLLPPLGSPPRDRRARAAALAARALAELDAGEDGTRNDEREANRDNEGIYRGSHG